MTAQRTIEDLTAMAQEAQAADIRWLRTEGCRARVREAMDYEVEFYHATGGDAPPAEGVWTLFVFVGHLGGEGADARYLTKYAHGDALCFGMKSMPSRRPGKVLDIVARPVPAPRI